MYLAPHVWGESMQGEGPFQRWDFSPSPQTCATHWGLNCSHPFLLHSIQLVPKALAFTSEAEKVRNAPCKKKGKKKDEWFFPLRQEVSLGDPACPRHSTHR